MARPRVAVVPALATVGGAVVPAAVFLLITGGGPAAVGWSVPIATDSAFAVDVLALLARRAPAGLRLLLLSIATVDGRAREPAAPGETTQRLRRGTDVRPGQRRRIAALDRSPLGHLPPRSSRAILALGLVCGLGFTVSLFVTDLAYSSTVTATAPPDRVW